MSKFLFLLFVSFSLPMIAHADEARNPCTYCTNLEDALLEPSQVIHLNLRATGLTNIPDNLNEFINLKTLDISQNLISEIDFTNLRLEQLEELNVSNNPGFDALNMDNISNALPSLKYLDLSSCHLIYLSNELPSLQQLRTLNVSNNAIRFIPNNLNQLTTLDVSQNDLQDTYCLIDSWDLEFLDISGNTDLNLTKVGNALKYKENLKELSITPDSISKKSLPTSLAECSIKQLTLKQGRIQDPNFQITKNDSITRIVLEDVEISSPERFKNWVNRFEGLEEIVFRNMTVPEFLDEISSLETMRFENVDFQDKMELRAIKPSIQLKALRTDIRTDGYIGNSKIANANSSIVEAKSDYVMSPEMRMNTLPRMVEPETEQFSFNSSNPQRIMMDFSSLDIPSQAFLTQSGQIYTGEVRVDVTEYMDPIIDALTGVPMTYRTDEEDVVFSSSGMFEFRAFDDSGNELNPNPENPIEVEMNDLMPSQSSDLYRFNDSINNWELLEESPKVEGWADRKAKLLDSLNKISDKDITNFYVLPVATLFQYKKSRRDPYVLSFKTVGTNKRVSKEKKYKMLLRTPNPDQRWIAKQQWKIDTLISPELEATLKDFKKSQRRDKKRWFKRSYRRNPDAAPRFLKDLTITPDFEKDNYRMEFTFKGKRVSLPVTHNFSGTLRRVQIKEKRTFKEYERSKALAQKDIKRIEKYEQTVLKQQAELIRERRAIMGTSYSNPPSVASERLRFGLGSPRRGFLATAGDVGGGLIRGIGTLLTFGLINVDTELSIPPKTVRMDQMAMDQNGESLNVPPYVRTVFPEGGGYLSVPYTDVLVPRDRKPIILFPISPSEIAVVRNWKKMRNGAKQATVERIIIAGLSPGEIQSLIKGKQ